MGQIKTKSTDSEVMIMTQTVKKDVPHVVSIKLIIVVAVIAAAIIAAAVLMNGSQNTSSVAGEQTNTIQQPPQNSVQNNTEENCNAYCKNYRKNKEMWFRD